MRIELVETPKGRLSSCIMDEGAPLEAVADFLDLLMSCPTDTVALRKEALAEAFFDLKTGVAGEFLQKVSNYRRRLIVIGDFGGIRGTAMKSFMRESNGTGKVVFAADLEAGIALLR